MGQPSLVSRSKSMLLVPKKEEVVVEAEDLEVAEVSSAFRKLICCLTFFSFVKEVEDVVDLETVEVIDLVAADVAVVDEDTEVVAEVIVAMAVVAEEVVEDTVVVVAEIGDMAIVDTETVAEIDTEAEDVEVMVVDVAEDVEVGTMEVTEAITTVTMEVIDNKNSSFLHNIYENLMYSTILEKYKKQFLQDRFFCLNII